MLCRYCAAGSSVGPLSRQYFITWSPLGCNRVATRLPQGRSPPRRRYLAAKAALGCRSGRISEPAPASPRPPTLKHESHTRTLIPFFVCWKPGCLLPDACSRRGFPTLCAKSCVDVLGFVHLPSACVCCHRNACRLLASSELVFCVGNRIFDDNGIYNKGFGAPLRNSAHRDGRESDPSVAAAQVQRPPGVAAPMRCLIDRIHRETRRAANPFAQCTCIIWSSRWRSSRGLRPSRNPRVSHARRRSRRRSHPHDAGVCPTVQRTTGR